MIKRFSFQTDNNITGKADLRLEPAAKTVLGIGEPGEHIWFGKK